MERGPLESFVAWRLREARPEASLMLDKVR